MIHPDLLRYLTDCKLNGIPLDQIKETLEKSGWKPNQYKEAFNQIFPQPEKPEVGSRKRYLLSILAVVSLLFVGGLTWYLFQYLFAR